MRGTGVVALLIACGGCGAKTGLFSPDPPRDAGLVDAPVREADIPDATTTDVVADASADADASEDASEDSEDASEDSEDASEDAPEETVPDAHHDASRVGCTDASIAYIFVVTAGQNLFRFDPEGGTFGLVGNIDCIVGSTNSMAVDRAGRAYVGYNSGSMFLVDTKTAKCKATGFKFPFTPDGWKKYGMGFSAIDNGPAEQLFIAEASYNHLSVGFGTVDTTTFAFTFSSPFVPPLGDAVELTGTADGRLYAFFLDPTAGSHLARVDKITGEILEQTPLQIGEPDSAFAFAYWGGDFIFFTAPQNSGTTATRYHPVDGALTAIAKLGEQVVGAGVSTCAPE